MAICNVSCEFELVSIGDTGGNVGAWVLANSNMGIVMNEDK